MFSCLGGRQFIVVVLLSLSLFLEESRLLSGTLIFSLQRAWRGKPTPLKRNDAKPMHIVSIFYF